MRKIGSLPVAQTGLFVSATGALVWLLLFTAPLAIADGLTTIARLLLFAMLVIAPLPLLFVDDGSLKFRLFWRITRWAYPPAAILGVLAFLIPDPLASALLASGWLIWTLLVALLGLVRFSAHRFARAEEWCIDAGLVYLSVGGVWLVLSRLGVNPLGFDSAIVLLTAVHFHYAGYVAPVIAGMTGRRLRAVAPDALPLFRLIALGIVAGMSLVAVGITFTALTGLLVIEASSVVVLASSLLALSYLTLRYAAPSARRLSARILLVVSALSPVVTMSLALAYALGRLTGAWSITIPQMVEWHGWLNAAGFAWCGLVGWLAEEFEPQDSDRRQ